MYMPNKQKTIVQIKRQAALKASTSTETHCNTLQNASIHIITLQHTATHCNLGEPSSEMTVKVSASTAVNCDRCAAGWAIVAEQHRNCGK